MHSLFQFQLTEMNINQIKKNVSLKVYQGHHFKIKAKPERFVYTLYLIEKPKCSNKVRNKTKTKIEIH